MDQVNLPFALNDQLLLSNLLGEQNQAVLSQIEQHLSAEASGIMYVAGEHASGKTHLLQASVMAAMDQHVSALYLDLAQTLPAGFLHNLDNYDWIAIDNIDLADTEQQQALFDLYNRVKNSSRTLIVSATQLPAQLSLLIDLKTRLSQALVFQLAALDDEQKLQVLNTKLGHKGLSVETKVLAYLLKQYSRDLSELVEMIEQLDKLSLQQKKAITIPFVKQWLKV